MYIDHATQEGLTEAYTATRMSLKLESEYAAIHHYATGRHS